MERVGGGSEEAEVNFGKGLRAEQRATGEMRYECRLMSGRGGATVILSSVFVLSHVPRSA